VNRRFLSGSPIALFVIVCCQLVCSAFFTYDMLTSVFLIPTQPISWETRETLEVGAVLGLIAGVVLGTVMLMRVLIERNNAELDCLAAERALSDAQTRLRRAAGAFQDLMEERFSEWGLTAAERDVALFAMKGFSLAQIAALRETTEGTVKTQTNSIYRKAGVNGRPQFLSLFIEDLLAVGPAAEITQTNGMAKAPIHRPAESFALR